MTTQPSRFFSPRARGFTLLELLAAIAIVAILAGLLIGQVNRSRDKALLAGCANNMRQLGMAMTAFSFDNNGNYPPAYGGGANGDLTWTRALVDGGYVTDTRLFRSPGDTLNKRPPKMGLSFSYCSPVMTGNTYVATKNLNRLKLETPSKQYLLTEWHTKTTDWSEYSQMIAGWDLGAGAISRSHSGGGRHFLFGDDHVELRTLAESTDPSTGWVMNEIRN